jgi:hypothetical protein
MFFQPLETLPAGLPMLGNRFSFRYVLFPMSGIQGDGMKKPVSVRTAKPARKRDIWRLNPRRCGNNEKEYV